MNKREIIARFLKEGILIPPELLERVNEENYEEILRSLREGDKKTKRKEGGIKGTEKKTEISVKEVLDYHSRKYEFLKSLLLRKMDAVSINKGKKMFSKIGIIGRVKEITGKGFVVEDVTGEVEVVGEGEVKIGDVIGVKGWFKEGVFLPEEIIWPDVPLGRETNLPSFILTYKPLEQMKNKETVIIDVNPEEVEAENPTQMSVMYGNERLRILVFKPEEDLKEEDVIRFLKRREVPKKEKEIHINYLLEDIPNIIWVIENRRNWMRNYKGVVLVSTDKESFFVYRKERGGEFLKYNSVI
ncbi:MAG: hypothetical protein ACXQTX_02450 [Candidatus Syntropharchaeia archaeon]